MIGEIISQILGIGHSENDLDFLSRNDASSIPRKWIFCPRFTDRGKHLYRFELYLFDLIQCNLMGSYPISSTTDGPSLTDQIVFHGKIQSDMLYSVYTSFHLFNHPFLSLLMKEITSYKNFK